MTSTSFTERVVAELAPHLPPLQCCRSALVEGMRRATPGDEVVSTRRVAARVALAAFHADGVDAHVEVRATARRPHYLVRATAGAASSRRLCCRRTRLRGNVLAAGRLSRGDAAPHAELPAGDGAAGTAILADCRALGIPARQVRRGGALLVTVRSASGVAVLLSSIGAQSGRLEFEEGRVVREVRGGVNRRLNAETANLRRSVSAAIQQIEAIASLRLHSEGWDGLPPAVREAAELRLRSPRDALEGLAAQAGCSRSAMADRLRRLLRAANATSDAC
ncbi:MAG: DNA-binding protein WhiA [Candidatus Dormibacteria bacterium]